MIGDRGATKSFKIECSSSGQATGCQFGNEEPIKCSDCIFSPTYEEEKCEAKAGNKLRTKRKSWIKWQWRWRD
jgi:hypothetical protein